MQLKYSHADGHVILVLAKGNTYVPTGGLGRGVCSSLSPYSPAS